MVTHSRVVVNVCVTCLASAALALLALAGLLGASQIDAASLGPNTTGMVLGGVVAAAPPTALITAAWAYSRQGLTGASWIGHIAAVTLTAAFLALWFGFLLNGGF